MSFTVSQLAKLAGISPRTLRYYDQIGLLAPQHTTAAGYRLYGAEQADTLWQILFYRELGLQLGEIRALLRDPSYDRRQALTDHRRRLLQKREKLERLLGAVDRVLAADDTQEVFLLEERFDCFKEQLVAENERRYGKEVRARYGDAAADSANAAMLCMSRADYDRFTALEKEILQQLDALFAAGTPTDAPAARGLAEKHRQWLTASWGHYDPAAHAALAAGYVADDRFRDYYDRGTAGRAVYLRDVIAHYTQSL